MKKTICLISAILFCLILLFGLSGCGSANTKVEVEGREESVRMLDDFFAKTFENPNFVATTSCYGQVVTVETIDGTSGCLEEITNDRKIYTFLKDGKYYTAVEDTKYYGIGENYYNLNYCLFMLNVNEAKEMEDGSFTCKVEDGTTLVFEVENNNIVVQIKAIKEDELVKSFTYESIKKDTNTHFGKTVEFTYGGASVSVPDLSDWKSDDTNLIDPNEE